MIIHPRLIGWLISQMVYYLSHRTICNSEQTRKLLVSYKNRLEKKSVVIWNGVTCRKSAKSAAATMEKYGLNPDKILVVLVGRINRWKGQVLLVKAVRELLNRGVSNVQYLIVGDPPHGQEHYLSDLNAVVNKLEVDNDVKIVPFVITIEDIWQVTDICVVPSTEPEPFGLVAAEAMQCKKPVVAANHGGLTEIVIDKVTGLLCEPGDVRQLADALQTLIKEPNLIRKYGLAGYERYTDEFSEKRYQTRINDFFKGLPLK